MLRVEDILTQVRAKGMPVARAYVSATTARELLNRVSLVPVRGSIPVHFGHEALGVVDWYVDETLTDDALRLESGAVPDATGEP